MDGYDHILKNNLGYKARNQETAYINPSLNILKNNYFELDVTITDQDFISLDETLLMADRKPDGSLPDIDFMKLHPSSDLIDKGTDIGFPFFNSAPDLGAFEQDSLASMFLLADQNPVIRIYPNPVRDLLFIDEGNYKQIIIVDVSGNEFFLNMEESHVDVSVLDPGCYLLKIITGNDKIVIKRFIRI